MCPIVPTLTCGFVRVNVSLAIASRLTASLVFVWRGPAQPPHTSTTVRSGRGYPAAWGRPLGPTRTARIWASPKSCRWDLNPGPRPYQGRALPTEPRQRLIRDRFQQSRRCPPGPDLPELLALVLQ